MSKKALTRRILVSFWLILLALLLVGCWGGDEIDALFIVTGVGLDTSDDPEKMNIVFQVAKTQAASSGDSGSSSADSTTVLLKTQRGTVAEAIADFNRDGSRKIFMQHNQVILIGSALAEEGIADKIDLFVRDLEGRMEVPILIVDGDAEELLSVEMDQNKISGLFLADVLERQASTSIEYRIRLLDFASRLLDESSSPIASMAEIVEEEGQDIIKITGMAVFQDGKMIGRLTNEETLGYIWAMGEVKNSGVVAKDDAGKAAFIIDELDTKKTLKLREDGGVAVKLSVSATLTINELYGYSEMNPVELIDHLIELSQHAIRQRIEDTFIIAQHMRADIYRFGVMTHRRFPKEWRKMREHWDDVFAGIQLDVEVKATIPSTGKVIESLKMKERNHDN
ncbi:MAG: Ger(x)C family spore germination protein [Christensenellales bacterium]|jgi:spore germination protein KC